MIVGLGIDLVDRERMDRLWRRFGRHLAERILSGSELKALPENPVDFLASRFAAKEAGVKALGLGFRNGINFRDLEVRNDDLGRPKLILHGKARKTALDLKITRIDLSITHSRTAAAAVVIMQD